MSSKKIILTVSSLLLVSFLFIWLRWYKIESSLYFFNDIGRDYLVLHKWLSTGKPPLLGPQTSALAYNQSAIYFYALFPLFLILNQSPFASLATVTLTYLIGIGLGAWWLRKEKTLLFSWIVLCGLVALQPQLVVQNRFVWNPSFVTIFLMLAFLAWRKLTENWQWSWLFWFGWWLSLASAFSYSVLPLIASWGLLAILFYWKKWSKLWWLGVSFGGSLLVVNLPTLAFELRHGFFLTKLLFTGERLLETNHHWLTKSESFFNFSVGAGNGIVSGVVFAISLLIAVLSMVTDSSKERFYWIRDALYLGGMTFILTLAAPVGVESHYIFPLVTLWLIALSFVRPKLILLVFLLLVPLWLRPAQLSTYFSPARRTVADLQTCAQSFCSNFDQPFFVSNQSTHHPYHNAMEFRYFFSWAGCDVKELDTQISEAQHMVVVLDDSIYEHGKTAFNELTQFGSSQESERFLCSQKLELVVLEKN